MSKSEVDMAEAPESDAREAVPFRVRTADGETIDLSYSSPRPAEAHDEDAVLGTLPWFEAGKPLHNWTHSSSAGNADLGKLQAQFDAYYDLLEQNGVRVNYIEPQVPAIGAYGYLKLQVDFSESHRFAIAGLHCATLELVRDQGPATP